MNTIIVNTPEAVEPTHFMCVWCDCEFKADIGELRCPSCGVADKKDLIPIYVDANPQVESMMTPDDFHGG